MAWQHREVRVQTEIRCFKMYNLLADGEKSFPRHVSKVWMKIIYGCLAENETAGRDSCSFAGVSIKTQTATLMQLPQALMTDKYLSSRRTQYTLVRLYVSACPESSQEELSRISVL